MINKSRTGVCILAAGFSSRMGRFKPLMPIGDEPAVSRLIGVFKETGFSNIVVVTGFNREALTEILQKQEVREAFNPGFEQGMFTSIQAGISSFHQPMEGYMVIPVDCPIVEPQVIEMLSHEASPGRDFYVPCFRGKKGHPLYIPGYYRDEIISYTGNNGLKGITDREPERMRRIETESESCVLDMDTPDSYEDIREFFDNGFKRCDIKEIAQGRVIVLVRHGQIMQHRERIFLGQTDVPLSDLGKEQACCAAEELAEYLGGISRDNWPKVIYSSDLQRAWQTADIIGQRTGLETVVNKDFREINLGDWDGRYISDIKREYPEEFERRGRDLKVFKIGNHSENFYDLEYRVNTCLRKILRQDNSKIVVIVAHSGVIRSIECNISEVNDHKLLNKMSNGNIMYLRL